MGYLLLMSHIVCLFFEGLSFKKGLVKLNASTDADMLHCFTLPPCNVNVAVSQLKKDRFDCFSLAEVADFRMCNMLSVFSQSNFFSYVSSCIKNNLPVCSYPVSFVTNFNAKESVHSGVKTVHCFDAVQSRPTITKSSLVMDAA